MPDNLLHPPDPLQRLFLEGDLKLWEPKDKKRRFKTKSPGKPKTKPNRRLKPKKLKRRNTPRRNISRAKPRIIVGGRYSRKKRKTKNSY